MPAIGRHHWLSGRHLPAHPLFELLTVDHYRCDPGTPRVPADDQWAHFWMAIASAGRFWDDQKLSREHPADAFASSGRFVLEATIRRFQKKRPMGASHTKRLLDAPWKRPTGAPPKLRPLDASMARPVGTLGEKCPLDASTERPTGASCEKRPLDGLVPIVQQALHQGCIQQTLSKHLLDAFTKKRPADKRVFEKPAPWCSQSLTGMLESKSQVLVKDSSGARTAVFDRWSDRHCLTEATAAGLDRPVRSVPGTGRTGPAGTGRTNLSDQLALASVGQCLSDHRSNTAVRALLELLCLTG
ncbi:hypothetical protein PCANC_01424 [Puccinia coronata f. sp. avenae]|uniref:Uncharacterized protein n=1 Tax=Puccinia coronata f. sp. avenae TaxID=200324 RepID=A0A2N5W6A8_9BASI|nr:hypothetical protein PCANC_01424 [Puccinia coronata f. sp. avenae]